MAIKAKATITLVRVNDGKDGTIMSPTEPLDKTKAWLDTSVSPSVLKRWNGSKWEIVNEVQIGGRNLLRGTAIEQSAHSNSTEATNQELTYGYFNWEMPPSLIKMGDEVTVSFEIKTSNGTDKVDVWTREERLLYASQTIVSIIPTTEWTKHSYTVTRNSSKDWWGLLFGNASRTHSANTGIMYVRNAKLERGNKATDWTPAPEDIDQNITDVEDSLGDRIDETNDNVDKVTANMEILEDRIANLVASYDLEYYKVNYDSVAGTYTKTTEQLVALEGLLVDGAMTDTGDNVFVGILNEVEIYFCVTQATEAKLVQDILLSVYRREYDGSFQELATELENNREAYITDPHPSLDFARYRIVATTKSTGAVSYYDVPGYPVNEKAIIIQWDDEWTTFDTYGSEDELAEPPWSGSMLKLPYNIDISDSNNADTSLIEYIGRKRPVSYYGTQIGETSTWNAEIEKSDIETLYTIRRLATWMGDVYVREPSGSGYWANISVSYSQKHLGLTIPVTFNITRVEGGA